MISKHLFGYIRFSININNFIQILLPSSSCTDGDVFCSQEHDNVLFYHSMLDLARINLYSGNYGEDSISNHIVGCYLFPGWCRIRH